MPLHRPTPRFRLAALTGGALVAGTALSIRHRARKRYFASLDQRLYASATVPTRFSPDQVAHLPEPAQRYLLHVLAPGVPLVDAVRLRMTGTMTPRPGAPPVHLTATETLAPRRGFVWSARARMGGLPVYVRDFYFAREGGVRVALLGLLPLPSPKGPDVARSACGRLVAEAVWCPAALVSPAVGWEAIDADHARYSYTVGGETIAVTLQIGPEGNLRSVALRRWGDAGTGIFQHQPYGFTVEEETTFEGITIPSRLRGGWWFGTERYDPATAASFNVQAASFTPPRQTRR